MTVVAGEAPLAGVHRFSHEAMATVFEVRCAHADARYARQATEAAFDLVDRMEAAMSRFIANSDISRVNALAAGRSTRVGADTLECLAVARHLYEATGGAFDVSLGTGIETLDLDPEAYTVHARRGGVQLDLGAIGKGYAVDRVAELLEEWDVSVALVHGGFSSVLALESPPGQEGWALTLSVPDGGPVLARLSARHRALGAPGTRKGPHIQDPRTGGVRTRRAAWVSLPRRTGARGSPAAVADALSTACMILSEREISDLCRDSPGLEAWLLSEPTGESLPTVLHLPGERLEAGGESGDFRPAGQERE
jgi:thiamine biosynthesis lipoprotein